MIDYMEEIQLIFVFPEMGQTARKADFHLESVYQQ